MANVGCTGTSAAARRPADPSFLDLPEVLADVSGNGTAVVNVHLAIPEADSEEYEAALHAQFVARRRIGQRDSAGMVLNSLPHNVRGYRCCLHDRRTVLPSSFIGATD